MLLLLHFLFSTILESPFHDIRLWGCTLNVLAVGELGPEIVEVLEFDQMPDLGERSSYDE